MDALKRVEAACLSLFYGANLHEVQIFANPQMWEYNHNRPNMALGGITPKQKLAMTAYRFYF